MNFTKITNLEYNRETFRPIQTDIFHHGRSGGRIPGLFDTQVKRISVMSSSNLANVPNVNESRTFFLTPDTVGSRSHGLVRVIGDLEVIDVESIFPSIDFDASHGTFVSDFVQKGPFFKDVKFVFDGG